MAHVFASSELRLLNFGCGAMVHPDWTNLDVASAVPGVVVHDLRTGFPFPEESYDATYGSHVLEHLDPDDGAALLVECHRILRPGGLVRIVVPDLEAITRLYLQALDAALIGDREAEARYDWMMLELLDQTVRTRPGGRMGRYLAGSIEDYQRRLIASRIGTEQVQSALARSTRAAPRGTAARIPAALRSRVRGMRESLARACAVLLLGRPGGEALREGLFRTSGEIHKWMYDRYSLKRALERSGFVDVRGYPAGESAIPGFAAFGFEIADDAVRKPDSLFMEGRKPPQEGALGSAP